LADFVVCRQRESGSESTAIAAKKELDKVKQEKLALERTLASKEYLSNQISAETQSTKELYDKNQRYYTAFRLVLTEDFRRQAQLDQKEKAFKKREADLTRQIQDLQSKADAGGASSAELQERSKALSKLEVRQKVNKLVSLLRNFCRS